MLWWQPKDPKGSRFIIAKYYHPSLVVGVRRICMKHFTWLLLTPKLSELLLMHKIIYILSVCLFIASSDKRLFLAVASCSPCFCLQSVLCWIHPANYEPQLNKRA